MRPSGWQLSLAAALAALSSGFTAASPDAPVPNANQARVPAYVAAYQGDVPGARAHEQIIDRGQFESLPDLVDSLLRLIPALTQYHRPDAKPSVSRVSRAQIETTMCGGAACLMRAWYLPEQGIYLEDNLHPETDLFDRSVLLHELVHYLQEVHGEAAELDACNRWYQREMQAYGLQNQYLELVGSPVRVTYPTYPCRQADILRNNVGAPGAFR